MSRKGIGAKQNKVLRLHIFGPGYGESVAIELPSGKWGVVDCCVSNRNPGVLGFLKKRGVQKLEFFCLTHPHADHFTGAELLLDEYDGRIARVWKYGGFSTKDILARLHMLSMATHERNKDPEAIRTADKFCKVMRAFVKLRKALPPDCYRHAVAPLDLFADGEVSIEAVRPCAAMTEELQELVMNKRVSDGCLVFLDEEGHDLNNLSVVLELKYGKTSVLLMGDAQGEFDAPGKALLPTVLKVPHHGSVNGLWANTTAPSSSKPKQSKIQIAIITPYSSSGLPKAHMVKRYANGSGNLFVTGSKTFVPSTRIVAGLANCRAVSSNTEYCTVEITSGGSARVVSA